MPASLIQTMPAEMVPIDIIREPLFFDCVPRWSWRAGRLKHFVLWAVFRGGGGLHLGDADWALGPGVVFLFRPGDAPTAWHDPDNPLLVYTVHFDFRSEPPADAALPPRAHEVLDMSYLEASARVSVSAWARGDPAGRMRALLAVWQVLLQLADEQQRRGILETDDRVSRIVARIDAGPGRRWTLAEMAGQTHMSVSTFCRVFRKMTGHAPARYLILRRLQQARMLLESTDLPIGEIAEALGYADVGFFSRQFKQIVGRSPSRHRAQTKQDRQWQPPGR